MLGDELRLEAALPVARDFYRQFAEFALERLAAGAVAGVTRQVGDGFMLAVPEVRGHLGLQGALYNGLGELLEQAVRRSGLRVSGSQPAVGRSNPAMGLSLLRSCSLLLEVRQFPAK